MSHRKEVRVDLNLDTSILGRAKREISEFSRDGHLGFLHASNGAREFHKALHGIVDEFPVLGVGFKALFGSIGAAITGATLAFEAGKKYLEDWNKEMDKAAEEAAKPIGLVREELAKLAIQKDKQISDQKHWLQTLHTEHSAEMANLQDRQKYVDRIYDKKKADLGPNASPDDLKKIENQRFVAKSSLYSAAELAIQNQIPGAERMATGAATFQQEIKQKIAAAEKELAQLGERRKGNAAGLASLDEKLKDVEPTIVAGSGFDGRVQKYDNPQYLELSRQRKELAETEQRELNASKKLEDSLRTLNQRLNEAAFQTDHWKGRTEELHREMEEVNKMDRSLQDANWDPSTPKQPDSDGGIAYRPIKERGIAYRPIKGAPGYKAPASDVVSLDPTKQAQATALDLFVQAMKSQGIPVYGSQ